MVIGLGQEWLDPVLKDLQHLRKRTEQMKPAWAAAARAVEEFVLQRFNTETDPEGNRWAPLSEEYADSGKRKKRKKAAKKTKKKARKKARKKVAKKATKKRRKKA